MANAKVNRLEQTAAGISIKVTNLCNGTRLRDRRLGRDRDVANCDQLEPVQQFQADAALAATARRDDAGAGRRELQLKLRPTARRPPQRVRRIAILQHDTFGLPFAQELE